MEDTLFVGVNGKKIAYDDTPISVDAKLLSDVAAPVRDVVFKNLKAQNIPSKRWHKVLHTGAKVVPKPFALKDSAAAAGLFVDAIESLAPDHKMAIWGDYDVDGNTASTVLGTLARQLSPEAEKNVLHYIPHRREGYGLNVEGIAKLADEGVKTLFVVDIGTVAHKEIEYARSRGMKVAVLDHHQPRRGQKLPEGALIINPHRLDEKKVELKDLSAAGISWLFARDVEETLRRRGKQSHIDHGLITTAACLGTISDVVSIENPLNRYIIDQGLKEMESGKYPGIEALKGLFGIKKIRESDIAFAIGPSINAAGRMNDPTVGMRMLFAKDQAEAEKLAKELTAYNDERKQFSNQIILSDALQKAEEFVAKHPDAPAILIEDSHWMSGVVGIIASRIKDRYGLPALLGTRYTKPDGQEHISYSARSIDDVHLFNALTAASNILPKDDIIKFGGHAMAAGVTIKADAKDRMVEALFNELKAPVQASRDKDRLKISAVMKPEDLTVDTVSQFYKYGAYGAKMTAPRILVKDVEVKQVREMGEKGEHLSVALGGRSSTAPFDSLRYGTAFRAKDSELGALLTHPNRHNQAFDVVIEPYVFEKKTGENAVGYHLIDASPARVVGHDPDPSLVLQAHVERIAEFRKKQEAEIAKISGLPLKIEELVEGKTPQSQRVLKLMHDAKVSLLDTETTGLNAGHPDHERTNGITQIAVSKVVKNDVNGQVDYKLVEKVFPILPVTPAFFEYQQQVKAAKKYKLSPPDYDKKRCEYVIERSALDVTGTDFVRTTENGPIKDMLVGGHKVEARPFYEVAGDVASFIDGTTPYAFNMPFDARVMKKHFDDVTHARMAQPDVPKIDIKDEHIRENYIKETDALAKIIIPAEGQESPRFMKAFSDPLHYSCVMHAGLLEQGEQAFNRLDNMAARYKVAFLRDHTSHDARDDTRPLPYMIEQQLKSFGAADAKRLIHPELAERYPGIKCKLEEELQAEGYNMQSLWKRMALMSDPKASVEVGQTAVSKKSGKKTTQESTQHLKINFPSAEGGELVGVGSYLSSLLPAQARNAYIPKLVLTADDHSVSLHAAPKENGNIPLMVAFKKAMCVDRLYRSGIASEVKAFDSTGLLDITLATKNSEKPVTIEDVPIAGLRKSLDFMLSAEARPHAKEYIELMRWFNDLPQAGLTTFDETGITVRGLQRGFGETKLVLPQGKKLIDCIPDIKSKARELLSIATLPGAKQTDYNVDEEESAGEEKKKSQSIVFSTDYKLDKPGNMLMEVSLPLLKLVAQEKGLQVGGESFNWPGGIVGQKADGNDHYLLNGSLESFSDVGGEIRNAAWLLYRFNQLPGVRESKTVLHEDGKLTLNFEEGVPAETLWIMHRAHVPFKAKQNSVEIAMPELMHDAYHWYWEIRKDHEFVKNEMEKKKPEKPPVFLTELAARLKSGSISDFETDREGKAFASVGGYPLVPVNSNVNEEVLARHYVAKGPIDSPLFDAPTKADIDHSGLAVRLSQLHGVQKNYSELSRAEDGKLVVQTPTLDPLSDRELLIDNFREISRLARSAHINPLLDKLRDVVKSEDMRPDHTEPQAAESPVTLARLHSLNSKLEALAPHLDTITKDVEAFQASFDEVRLKDTIFRNVAELNLIQKSLAGARAKGELNVSDREYDTMQSSLKEYYESLSMAEFKRYRLTLDGLQMVKSIERLKKVVDKQEEKLASNPPYGAYAAHKELSGALEKLWDDGKRYKRTLHFSDEIIACSANLRDWRKLAAVQKAVEITRGIESREVDALLQKIKAEGGIVDFTATDDHHWTFDSTTLEKNAQYWDNRIAQLQQGKQVIPQVPHMVIDTSSMLTLLLGNESVPGDKQAGYLGLVQDLAKHGAVIPVFTGAVLAEFLNSPAPLTPQDIFTMDSNGKAVGVKYTDENRRHQRFRQGNKSEVEYPKWNQRLEFLKEMYNNGHAKFIQTSTESLYYDAIRGNEELAKSFDKIAKEHPELKEMLHNKTHLKELSNDELKAFLLTPHDARQKFMYQMRSEGVRKDIGEVSLADAVQTIHDTYGTQTPTFVLYEGNDVRGRLLKRKKHLSDKSHDDTYMAGHGKDATLTPDFDPTHSKFNPDHTSALGNTNFLSTLGFVAGLMQKSKEHEVFIMSPDEHKNAIPADIDNPPHESYPGMGEIMRSNAGKALNGYTRAYNKMVDEPATEFGKSPRHSASFTGGEKGPWQRQLDAANADVLREIFASHLIRERKFQETKLGYHGDSSAQAARDIMTIDKHLAHVVTAKAPQADEKAQLASSIDKATDHKQPEPSAILLDVNDPDPRAVRFAQSILKQHAAHKVAAGEKAGIRPRLPEGMNIELLAVPSEWRATVVEDTCQMLRTKLCQTPEDVVYASEYESLLRKLLPQTKRSWGMGGA